MEIVKNGMFTIAGRPNVGKSTLLNRIAGAKIAIVSDKPQTTRTRICGIVNRDGGQYIFMDTPGFHKPRNRLGDFMMGVVRESVADTDAVILMTEPVEPGTQEELLMEQISEAGMPCILVINKIDTVPEKEKLLAIIASYTQRMEFDAVVPVSAKTGEGVDALMEELSGHLCEGPALYPEDMLTDQPERAIMAELVREKLLLLLSREVPHGTAVEIETYRERDDGVMHIGAVIYAEKASHKGIIIGKNGAMLKKIGAMARADMEDFLDCKVFLELWVKVKEGWRDNTFFMRNFGYEQN